MKSAVSGSGVLSSVPLAGARRLAGAEWHADNSYIQSMPEIAET
ncbi:hypothetical protein [Anabaena sp. CCY 9402-a]